MLATQRKSPFTNQLIFLAVVVLTMSIGYSYMRRDAMGYYVDRYAPYFPFFYSSVNDYLSTNINSTHVAKLSRSTASFFPIVLDKNKQSEMTSTDNLVVIEDTEADKENNTQIDTQVGKPHIDMETGNIIVKPTTFEETIIPDQDKEVRVDDEIITEKITNGYSEVAKDISTPSPKNNDRFFIIAGSFSNESNANRLVSDLKQKGYNALIADTNKYGMYRVAFMSFNNRTIANNKLLAIRNESNPKAWLLVK